MTHKNFKCATLIAAILALSANAFAVAPSKLVLKNQFGEESINVVQGSVLPLPGAFNVIVFSGATAPVDNTTGLNVAGPGSIYIARDSGLAYQQTSLISTPAWVAMGSAGNGALLTGFVAGAGTVASTDTILQGFNKLAGNSNKLLNGGLTPTTETVSAAGAVSTTVMESTVSNAGVGTFAVTLAAPSSQDGQLKLIKMGTATHTVTLALTNVVMSGGYTPAGTTTLTFTSAGDSAVFIAVGAKWVYLGGSAVAS